MNTIEYRHIDTRHSYSNTHFSSTGSWETIMRVGDDVFRWRTCGTFHCYFLSLRNISLFYANASKLNERCWCKIYIITTKMHLLDANRMHSSSRCLSSLNTNNNSRPMFGKNELVTNLLFNLIIGYLYYINILLDFILWN